MRILLVVFCLLSVTAFSRSQMWTITGDEPFPLYDQLELYDKDSVRIYDAGFCRRRDKPLLCGYLYPGERFLSDTAWSSHGYTRAFKQNGMEGIVPVRLLQLAKDTVCFKFTFGEELFVFSSDTSVYARSADLLGGWRCLISWRTYKDTRGVLFDSLNVALWTKRAYDGNTEAMLWLLTKAYGDGLVESQFTYGKWKLINHWTDSALAELLLKRWAAWDDKHRVCNCVCGIGMEVDNGICTCGFGPAHILMDYYNRTPFNDLSSLRNYYSLYYPLCYSLLELDETKGFITPKLVRKFRRQIRKRQQN